MARSVLTLSDGHAGNDNQAGALAAALSDTVEPLVLAPRAPWRWLAPRGVLGAGHALGAAFAARLHAPWPDLVIGCGRQAALATRVLSRASGGRTRTVQILDPRIDPRHYDCVVVPAHDELRGDNVIQTLGNLNAIDEAWLAQARRQFSALGQWSAPRYAVLLGGPTAAVQLDQSYWSALVAALKPVLEHEGASLMLSSSRRTPAWMRQAAREAFAKVPGVQWHGPDDGENPYAGFLAWADAIVVTPDSVNLLSEAAATGASVWTFAPSPIQGKVGRFVQALCDSGRIARLGVDAAAANAVPLRETADVAARIRARLGWDESA